MTAQRQDSAAPPPSGPGLTRRPRRTLRQHILRRLLVIIPIALTALLAAKMGWLPKAADKVQFNELAWFDNTKLTEHLRLLVKDQGCWTCHVAALSRLLTGLTGTCDAFQFLVRATDGCPGVDGKTATAFTILVNKADRTLQNDAGSPGHYHPMPASDATGGEVTANLS